MTTTASKETKGAREKILDVAEEFFREGSFVDVSVRDLTEKAGVNVASVNYHFGSKRKLYLEVLRRIFASFAQMKITKLGQEFPQDKAPDLRKLIETYVGIYLGSEEALQRTQGFLSLIARELSDDSDAMELLMEELVIPVNALMKQAIHKARPQMDEKHIALCLSSITGQAFHFARCPAAIQSLTGETPSETQPGDLAKHIVEFSLRGIGEEIEK